jgi:hypothetical protein
VPNLVDPQLSVRDPADDRLAVRRRCDAVAAARGDERRAGDVRETIPYVMGAPRQELLAFTATLSYGSFLGCW